MFAFVLLFAVAFAQTTKPTKEQCATLNATWVNDTTCVCNTTGEHVIATASTTTPVTYTYACKKCEGDKPVYNETTLACVAAPANNTNNTTNVTCNAALYLTLNTTTNNTCVCMEGFTAQANNTTVPCFCNATTHEIQNATNGAKKCVTKPAPGPVTPPANNTNTTNVTCNATLYLTLNATSNQCVCMAGFTAQANNATHPCVCNTTGSNIIKIKDNEFKCDKCGVNTTYNATTQTCMPPAVVPGTNTTNTTNVTCNATLYLTLNTTTNNTCVCMAGFTAQNNATAPCVCNTTGANIIKIKDNDYKCDKCGANQNYDAKTQTCVNKPNNGVNGLFVLLAMALFFLF